MRRFLVVLGAALAVACAAQQGTPAPAAPAAGPTVILISFDGFRWDYPSKAPAPNLRALTARGVQAEGLIPSYPSKTFPNHYTIATGLYPGTHGIVANTIRDPATGRVFSSSAQAEVRDAMWWAGEPIWVTAQQAGLVSAAMFWPGTDAPIKGTRPRYWKQYDESYPANDRVDQVLAWLDLPQGERPNLVTLYFEDVDTAGHDRGPDSDAVRDAIARVDGYLGRLIRGLEQRMLLDRVNIIVTADHGMAATSTERVVVLNDYISLDDVEIVEINPTIGLAPKPGKMDRVYSALAAAHPRLKVYRREETPAHWHYRDHPRIPPIVGVVDEGWQLLRRTTLEAMRQRTLSPQLGSHGYDPSTAMSMRAIFVAAGPAFKQGVTVPAFENIHIYNALARILGVTPAPNDGDPAIAQRLLN